MRSIDPSELKGRDRYALMTSLVVPRPVGWISTWGADEVPNLAPYSYFNAVSSSPLLVAVSIGHRRDGLKDTLVNMRARGAFCVNVVTEELLEPMNASSEDVAPDVDEFELAGLTAERSPVVDAPYVGECRAVLDCTVRKEVDLDGALNTLVIGQVLAVRLDPSLPFSDGTMSVDAAALRPVGRLANGWYAMPGELRRLDRPGRR